MYTTEPAPIVAGRHHERGIALVIAIFFTIFGLGLILSGSVVMDAASRRTEVAFRLDAQARQFATAGLIDALAWFRRQQTQPVAEFLPRRDELADPPVLDTDDPEIGIVRQFEISRGVWGRYEVRRFVPNLEPPTPEVADVSSERGAGASGAVWRLVSRGFVFRRASPDVAYNELPNQMLGVEVMESEIRRLALAPPAQAALCVRRAVDCAIGARSRVRGGEAAGVCWTAGSGTAAIAGEVSGKPATAGITEYLDGTESVFGVDAEQLRSLADDRVARDSEFPAPVPVNHIVFVESNLNFTKDRPLKGTGIVYVRGNVTIAAGSNSFFNGLLYVTGNLTVQAPSLLRGTVIVLGRLSLSGVADYVEIEYDDEVLNTLMVEIGQYRLSSTIRRSDLRGTLNK